MNTDFYQINNVDMFVINKIQCDNTIYHLNSSLKYRKISIFNVF